MSDALAALQKALLDCRGDHLVASFFSASQRSDWFAQPWYAIALGKASLAMMEGALAVGGSTLVAGLVVSKQDSGSSLSDERLICLTAAHPVPDESSLQAGQALLTFVQQLPSQARVLFLLSGGASALVEVLPDDWSLARWQEQTQQWLASGWDIQRINQARKNLSLVKGGKLLVHFPEQMGILQLIIADVPNQDLAAVGSGLLLADVVDERVSTYCLADNRSLLASLALYLPHAEMMPAYVSSEVNALAVEIASKAVLGQCTVWGGEPVVQLPEHAPMGGRMQHLALAVAWQLRHTTFPWSLIALASDGDDGNSRAAGAWVNEQTIRIAECHGWSVEATLAQANAHALLADVGALIETGYTGTNVNDVMILCCGDGR